MLDILSQKFPKTLVPDSPDLEELTAGGGDYTKKLIADTEVNTVGVVYFSNPQAFTPHQYFLPWARLGTYFSTTELHKQYTDVGVVATGILFHLLTRMEYYNFVFVTPNLYDEIGISKARLNQELNVLLKAELLVEIKGQTRKQRQDVQAAYYDSYQTHLPSYSRLFQISINVGFRGQPRNIDECPQGFYIKGRTAEHTKFMWRYGTRTILEGLRELQHKGRYVVNRLQELWNRR
jgi:hypothetical protein